LRVHSFLLFETRTERSEVEAATASLDATLKRAKRENFLGFGQAKAPPERLGGAFLRSID